MNHIPESGGHYRNISITAAAIAVVMESLTLYLLSALFPNLWSGNGALLLFILSMILGITYLFISYVTVKTVYLNLWIQSNRSTWVEGEWLHIHAKNNSNIRFGTVKISQAFHSIRVNGHNYGVPKNGKYPKETAWSYVLGKVLQDDTARDFIGCYSATNFGKMSGNDGVHTLTMSKFKDDFPVEMVGRFRNTFNVEGNGIQDIGDNFGELYFFKISDSLKNYLYSNGMFQYQQVMKAVADPQFSQEPFIAKLTEVIAVREREEKKRSQKTLESHGMTLRKAEDRDFFISYAGKDSMQVQAIVAEVEKHNHSCWVFERDSSGVFSEKIVRALNHSRQFILFLSPNSIESEHVHREISLISDKQSVNKNIPVIPVELTDLADVPHDKNWYRVMYFLTGLDRLHMENKTPQKTAEEILAKSFLLEREESSLPD